MRCLFAVSSRLVQRVIDEVNIDLGDVTNKYYTVLYRTVVVYEKKNRSLVFSSSRKISTLGSTVHWETRQASFPTGTVGPRVGIFLSPLNINDGFYLSHPRDLPIPSTLPAYPIHVTSNYNNLGCFQSNPRLNIM